MTNDVSSRFAHRHPAVGGSSVERAVARRVPPSVESAGGGDQCRFCPSLLDGGSLRALASGIPLLLALAGLPFTHRRGDGWAWRCACHAFSKKGIMDYQSTALPTELTYVTDRCRIRTYASEAAALPLSYPDRSGVGIEPTTHGTLVQKRFRQSAYRTATEPILRGHTETLARYYVEPFKPLSCKSTISCP